MRGPNAEEECARKLIYTPMRLFSEVEDTNSSSLPPTTPLHNPTALPTTPTTPNTAKPSHFPQQRGVTPFPNLSSPNPPPSPYTYPSLTTPLSLPPLTLPFTFSSTPYQPCSAARRLGPNRCSAMGVCSSRSWCHSSPRGQFLILLDSVNLFVP